MVAGKLDEAEQLVRKHLADHPKDVDALAQLAYLHYRRHDREKAFELVNQALSIDPDNAGALYYRATFRMGDGPAGAEAAIRDLTAARAKLAVDDLQRQIRVRATMGEALRLRGRFQQAAEELELVLRLDPANRWVRYRLVDLYANLHPPRWAPVERLIRDGKAQEGGDRDPYWPRVEARMWLSRQHPDKAVAAIRQAVHLTREAGQDVGPLLAEQITILAAAGRHRDVIAEVDNALRHPTPVGPQEWLYQCRAVAHARLGEGKEAERDFDDALQIAMSHPGGDAAAYAVIQVMAQTLGYPAAVQRVQRFSAKGSVYWLTIQAYLQIGAKDLAGAQATIERALKDKDRVVPQQRASVLNTAGSVYMLQRRYPEAQAVYEEAISITPDDAVALNNLACIYGEYLDPPNPRKCLSCAQRAHALVMRSGQPNADVKDTLGWALFLNGQVDQAIEMLRASLDISETPAAHVHLAAALLARPGREEQAREELDRAKIMLLAARANGGYVDPALDARLAALLKQLDAKW
jgi:tetratricopeptide (TPR) repeat protein